MPRSRDACAARIDVYPDQGDRDAATVRPVSDPAQKVALAEADVEQAEADQPCRCSIQIGQQGMRGEGPAIHPRQPMQDTGIGRRIELGRIHLFLVTAPGREIGHGTVSDPSGASIARLISALARASG